MKWNEQGFSLIEVLIAVSLMAIALAGLASMDINTIRADTRSTRTNVATALAHAKLEELRTVRRSDPDWADGSHGPETGLSGDGSSGSGLFSREWLVERNYNNFDNFSRVTVTVSWDDGSVSLTSVYW